MKLFRVSLIVSLIVFPGGTVLASSSSAHPLESAFAPEQSAALGQIATEPSLFNVPDRGIPGRREGGGTR